MLHRLTKPIALVAAALLMVPMPVMGSTLRASGPAALDEVQIDFNAMPQLSQIRIGDRELLVTRVANGFVVDEQETDSTWVLSDRELEEYAVSAPSELDPGQGMIRVALSRTGAMNGYRSLNVDIAHATGSGFVGTVEGVHETLPIAFQSIVGADNAGADFVAGELAVTFTLVISAATLGVLTCAVNALITNCASDCAEACSLCDGGYLLSSEEGFCGTCTCKCGRTYTGIQQDIPNGAGCGVY